MRKCLVLAAAMLALVAAPAFGGDGHVSKSTLRSLGLGQMTVMSDAEGMKVRGMSSNAQHTSLVSFSFILNDPQTGSSLSGFGSDFGRGTAENAGLAAVSNASSDALTGAPLGVNFTTLFPNLSPNFTGTISIFSFNSTGMAGGF